MREVICQSRLRENLGYIKDSYGVFRRLMDEVRAFYGIFNACESESRGVESFRIHSSRCEARTFSVMVIMKWKQGFL